MTLPTGLIALGEVRYDPDRRAILGPDDAPVSLRPQSLGVLHALASNPGEVVSKDDLIKAVWKDLNVTDDSLTQCIADIRRAIGDSNRLIVQTVPKRGYRLQVVETVARSHTAMKALTWLAAGMACLAVALFVVWQFRTPPKDDSPLF
ncbi:transcriptional regulator [Ruegeria sp. 2012CJ15-1]